MKNALNYVTYGICSAAVLSASFIGFAVFSGTPVQDLKGVGSLFADDVEVELEGETDGGEVASRAERSADTRSTRQVFDEAGLALGSFTLPSPFSVEELNSLEAQLKTKLDELAVREESLAAREREVQRTRDHLADLEVALEEQRTALLRQSDENAARSAEIASSSSALAQQSAAQEAESDQTYTELAQLFTDNKAEDAARILTKAHGPEGAAQILVRLEADRQAQLMEAIETQRPDEFVAYYTAFKRALGSKAAAGAR